MLPSTVPTGPLQINVSVSLTVQVVTPLGVANKLMAPGVTERNRPEEGHFHQEVLSPEEDESSKAIVYYSFPVFRLIGQYSFLDLFHSIQRSIRSLSLTFPNTPAPRTETGSVTNFINHRLAVRPLLGKRALSPKCAHVLCTLCICPHVLCTLYK